MGNKGPFSRWVFRNNTFVLLEGIKNGDRLKGTEILIIPLLGTGPLGKFDSEAYNPEPLARRINKAKYL